MYECELVGEYEKFRNNHFSEEHFSRKDVRVIQAISVAVLDGKAKEKGNYIQAEAVIISDKESEKKFYIDSFSYDQEELKEGCFMSQRHVIPIECGTKTVTEGIGNHYKIETDYYGKIKTKTENLWEPLQPVFISAQMGQGKNYFIENTLLPYVRELNLRNKTKQKILILSNRLALKKQIEAHLNRDSDLEDEDGKIYSYGDYADVMTYQSLLYQQKHLEDIQAEKNIRPRYIFVICDEAHFFTSDAMFNPHTKKILETIVRVFQNAIRIYMSATPYECLEYIVKYEEEYKERYLNWNKPQDKWVHAPMVFYHYRRNYDYLDVKIYSNIEELYERIVNSVKNRKGKWLIFIDDIEKCNKVKIALEKKENDIGDEENVTKKINIAVVDANSKENSDYNDLVLKEMLGKKIDVLITTSVLDNGINLWDVDNIVVSDMEKIKCLQMAGRSRIKDKNDRKTLFIKRFDKNYVGRRIEDFEEQRDAYHQYDLAYGNSATLSNNVDGYKFMEKYYNHNSRDWENAKHWFGRTVIEPENLYLNEIARSLAERMVSKYKIIYNEMENEYNVAESISSEKERKRRVGQSYLEYQLSWFGKTYSLDDDVTFVGMEKGKKDFLDFLESHAESGEIMESEAWNLFQKDFISLFDVAFYKSDQNSRNYGASKMNKLLEKINIGYKIDGNLQKGPWKVIHYKW